MNDRYSPASMGLHWIMAIAMIAAFVLGERIEDLARGAERQWGAGLHVAVGLMVALLLVPRVYFRLRGVPLLPAAMPDWEKKLARLGHLVLYGIMVLLPITGLVGVVTGSRGVSVLGLFTIPPLVPIPWLHEGGEGLHEILAKILLLTVVLHVAATVWHALVRRDGVAQRMLPF